MAAVFYGPSAVRGLRMFAALTVGVFINSHGRIFPMKRIMTLALAAAMVFGAATGASAIDFKASGQWILGMSAGEANFVDKHNGRHADSNDTFSASQRVRLQLDAVASEALSGTV